MLFESASGLCFVERSQYGAIGLIEVERSWAFGSVVSKVSLALSVKVDRRRTQLGFRFGCCVWVSELVWCCRGVA